MKSRMTRVLGIGIALMTVVAANAQDKSVTANVPFNFYIGSSEMPQGVYKVSEFSLSAVVRLESADAAKSVSTHGIVGKKEVEPARLVFHRFGESYFLAEIWSGAASAGRALSPSSREKEIALGSTPTLAVIRIALPQ